MRTAAVAVLLGLLVLAGCGAGRLSRSQYAKRADAICKRYNDKINALHPKATPRGLVDFAGKAIPLAKQGVHDFGKLEPPKDEQATADQWIAANDRVIAAIVKLRDAAKANDSAKARQALAEGSAANKRASALATQLGMKTCASG